MPFALNFYHDQIAADGSTAAALAPAHRLLYVRHGHLTINGTPMSADEAIYCEAPLTLKSAGEWSQVWRWELAPPNAPPALHEGMGVLSSLRMSRVISNLAMLEGTRWLFRLDRITSAAGRVADRHQHPGPGIRCLLEGAFNVQQDAESASRPCTGRCLVGDRIGYRHRLGIATDGGTVSARHGPAGRMGGQGDRNLAFGTRAARGQLEALRRSCDRGVRAVANPDLVMVRVGGAPGPLSIQEPGPDVCDDGIVRFRG